MGGMNTMDAQTQRWITVLATGDPFLVAVAKTLLDSAGIHYMTSVENPQLLAEMGCAKPKWSPITGSTELSVPADQAEDALYTLFILEDYPSLKHA